MQIWKQGINKWCLFLWLPLIPFSLDCLFPAKQRITDDDYTPGHLSTSTISDLPAAPSQGAWGGWSPIAQGAWGGGSEVDKMFQLFMGLVSKATWKKFGAKHERTTTVGQVKTRPGISPAMWQLGAPVFSAHDFHSKRYNIFFIVSSTTLNNTIPKKIPHQSTVVFFIL